MLVWLPTYCLCLFILFPFCSPAFPVYQSFRWLMSLKEREKLCACMFAEVPPRLSETGWYLNCRIYTSLWPRRQVFLAWTLPLYTNIHAHVSDKRERMIVLPHCCILIPTCFFLFFFFYNIRIFLPSVTMNKSSSFLQFYHLNIAWNPLNSCTWSFLAWYCTVHTWAVCAEPSAVQHMSMLKEHPSATEPPVP